MTEEFNPNAFRQQMAQQAGQIPMPVAAPQAPPAQPPVQQSVQPVRPQPYTAPAGQAYPPQQAAPVQQQHAPQQAVPYQGAQQGGQVPPAQFQPPQQQFQPQLQQGYAHPPQNHDQQPMGHPQGYQMMPETAAPEPKAKRSLFKRKKLKAMTDQATSQMPQVPQIPEQMPQQQMGAALSALPTTGGVARPIVFAAGLMLGVLGTMLMGKMFSGGKQAPVKVTANQGQLSALVSPTKGSAQAALTDEMLLNSKANKNGEP